MRARRGITLIETMVAGGISAIVLTAAFMEAGTYGGAVASNDCPAVCRAATGAEAVLRVQVQAPQEITRHGETVTAKRIAVDVAWGKAGHRRSLNGLAEAGAASCGLPIVVWKTETERGQ